MSDFTRNRHRDGKMFGANATEWLRRWDAGQPVWSIEMGGLGPGYKQAIQITVAEIVRHMLAERYEASLWADADMWRVNRDAIEKLGHASEAIKKLGLTGAQWGAALNLAAMIYSKGPCVVMNDPHVKDRHIQVSRTFP